ncbi:MAG: glycerol-3-phosphate dehydrogenase, partial [Proteobacteria bacterium]|nr:glycerol-3-phosphate dehydrogenase [Pseudomonadota bacterium]
ELDNCELTGTVLAGKSKNVLQDLAAVLKNDYFIPYVNNDMNGVEMGGALKNIYAIVSGYFHQKGVGENTIGLLLTKCLEEMRLFSQAKGANFSTFLGLSGVGDFFSTALSKDSRNYRFGTLLAKDFSVEEALKEVNDTVEGYQTSLIVFEEAQKMNLNLQILNFLISIYESTKSLEDAKEIFRSKSIEEDIKLKG